MPNRKRYRKIMMPPMMEGFKPFGIPVRQIEKVILLFEEYEAIRLCDYENLTQEEAAERMHISRPTFNRLYNQARDTIAKAFIEGRMIMIQGGTFKTDNYWFRCYSCNETMMTLKPIALCRKCNSENISLLTKQLAR